MKQDRIECLITGCGLLTSFGYAWGDLHAGGQCYIFNAVMLNGETNWNMEPAPHHNVLSMASDKDFFGRRGVIVIPKMNARLNENAQAYLDGAPS